METGIFIHGMIIGIALAAPVGPIALICIQRTVAEGRLHGIISGIGVATADACYAAVVAFGLALISDFLLARQWFFRLFGGIVLIAVGIRILMSIPPDATVKPEHESFVRDYYTMLALTIANPLTILFFTIIIPGFGVVIGGNSSVSPAAFVVGVFAGEVLWWVFLCGTFGSMRSYLNRERLSLINRIAGLFITIFGSVMIVSLLISGDIV
jgi:threonine/homoserine/homoserine lactone efflux protein